MSGFFSAFNTSAASVADDPFAVDANTYEVSITGSDYKTFPKTPTIPYFVVQLTIIGGPNAGKTASSMHRCIPWTAQERPSQGDFEAMNARLLSNYKRELIAFGISEEGLDQFDPTNPTHRNSLLGIKGTAFIETKNGFTNYKDFQRAVAASPVEETAANTSEAQATPAPDADAIAALMGNF